MLLLLGTTISPGQARNGDIIGICVTHHYNVIGGDTPSGKPVQAKLNSIILHGISFEKEDIATVLKYLSEQSKRLDPEHAGVKIRLDLSVSPEVKNFPVRRIVNLKVGDEMCLAEALAIVCEVTNLGYRIEDDVVILEPM
jgi:uncharacterized protein YbaR (Trm112 family)